MALQANRVELGQDGTIRKAHYGEGKQPWDTMVELGISSEFAAGSILKYLRRDKDKEHSIQSAKWYFQQLTDALANATGGGAATSESGNGGAGAFDDIVRNTVKVARVYTDLIEELSDAEIALLIPPT